MTSAIIVGSGPNGLAAAARLARAGVEVTVLEAAETPGGGTRTSEMLLPGLLHDHCSAVHQIAAGSPFFDEIDLRSRGLRWLSAPVDCVHPLDDGSAGVLHQSIEQTADALGADGRRWRRMFGLLSERFDDVFADISRPILGSLPNHPLLTARFGAEAALPATAFARLFKTEQGKALFGGMAAHTYYRLDRPLTSAVGLMIIVAGHAKGWVVAEGGSQSISQALIDDIEDHGGRIETGHRVDSIASLVAADIVMLDVSPSIAADILGDRLPPRIARSYRRFKHGPGAYKVDFAIEGGVPWTVPDARQSGTVHLGGSFAETAANEKAVYLGEMPERPFVLVSQQYLADPGRSVGDVHPLWTYAHVPHGYTGDATQAIVDQIERFAPGFQDRIVGTAVRSTTEMSVYNANYVGGDIIGGASTPTQLLFRPRITRDPYATGIPGVYLCSASTPPGAGAHGMCGANAAASALGELQQ